MHNELVSDNKTTCACLQVKNNQHVCTSDNISITKSYQCIIKLLEKWAQCYRRFEHGDTDTNMYVER